MASRGNVLILYKTLLREAGKFPDFNFRCFFLRRIRDGFRENRNLTVPSQVQEKITDATKTLEIIKRQVVIGEMFRTNQILSVEAAST